VDVDVFVAAHRREWERLEELVRRSGRMSGALSGADADELVALYQRAATHLSTVRSAAPDPALVGRLSTLVARARAAVTGAHTPALRDVAEFFTRRFPAAVYRCAPWWVAVAVAFLAVSAALGAWITATPEVQATIAAPEEIRMLTAPGGAYESYYSSAPAASFAARVWTNNALVAAGSLLLGVFLGVPVLVMLWLNAVNVAVGIGLMTAAGRLDVFLGLVTPHGLLELTAVFVAAGTGLRLGWTVVDPGPRSRPEALAHAGRSAAGMAVGLTGVLLVSGVIEAFVTPSGLPTWGRIGVGVVAEALFLAYVFGLGRRAALAGETGDVAARDRGDVLPTSG
jgi:uncharacterized membrane protein SpoIIM required for sporulation